MGNTTTSQKGSTDKILYFWKWDVQNNQLCALRSDAIHHMNEETRNSIIALADKDVVNNMELCQFNIEILSWHRLNINNSVVNVGFIVLNDPSLCYKESVLLSIEPKHPKNLIGNSISIREEETHKNTNTASHQEQMNTDEPIERGQNNQPPGTFYTSQLSNAMKGAENSFHILKGTFNG